MDKQEAIKILKDMVEYQWGFSDEEKSEGIDALKIAIESLEKELKGKNNG